MVIGWDESGDQLAVVPYFPSLSPASIRVYLSRFLFSLAYAFPLSLSLSLSQ